jgi:hypothetical protein
MRVRVGAQQQWIMKFFFLHSCAARPLWVALCMCVCMCDNFDRAVHFLRRSLDSQVLYGPLFGTRFVPNLYRPSSFIMLS